MALKYQRILLKISGEALGGEKGMGFDEPTMDAICGGVKKAHELGVQIGIVVGGGNFWRGRSSGKMERTLLRAISKAIMASDVGINPIDDGQTIRLNFPAPTEERRKQLAKEVSKLGEEAKVAVRNIRIKFLGDRTVLDPKLQELMNKLETESAVKTGMTLNIAINYGGRPEIVRAAQALAAKAAAGEIALADITEQALSDAMYTAGQKDPDFILRPSGEKRLSNFMLWQAAYSELVEMDVLWPDFTRDDLDAAIEEFNHRSRRFGGL